MGEKRGEIKRGIQNLESIFFIVFPNLPASLHTCYWIVFSRFKMLFFRRI